MRVFLDTNVLASAFATRGLCADLLRHVLGAHTLVLSPAVLDELRGVLRDKLGVPPGLVRDALALLKQGTVAAGTAEGLDLPIDDPSDVGILSSAVAARADVFVTGDRELQDLGAIGELRILSPRQFWEEAKAQRADRADDR